jgi:hypothetical protein
MSDEHTYGRDEWQTVQLHGLTVTQLEAENAATTLDDYRAKVEAEFRRRGLRVPDPPKPKRKSRDAK